MFEFIKTYRQRKLLHKHIHAPRTKKIHNIADAETIGILFVVGDQNQWNALYQFAKRLEKQGTHVWMLGLQRSDTVIHYVFTHPQTTVLHEKEDCRWGGIPQEEKIAAFVHRHYDLLIDTTDEPNFYGKYLALRCHADLKTTLVNSDTGTDPDIENIFDLLIQSPTPLEPGDYLMEVEKCLSMVRK